MDLNIFKVLTVFVLFLIKVVSFAQQSSQNDNSNKCCNKKVIDLNEYEKGSVIIFENTRFKFRSYGFDNHILHINDKEYKLDCEIESPEYYMHLYKHYDNSIIFFQADDYYSSSFYVYLYEDKNLFYLGMFDVDEPKVEDIGKYKINFNLIFREKQVLVQILLNGKISETISFNERKLVKQK